MDHLVHLLQLCWDRLHVLCCCRSLNASACSAKKKVFKKKYKNKLQKSFEKIQKTVGGLAERWRVSGREKARAVGAAVEEVLVPLWPFLFPLAISRICIFHATMYNIHIYKSFNCTKHKRDASKSQRTEVKNVQIGNENANKKWNKMLQEAAAAAAAPSRAAFIFTFTLCA